MCIIHEDMLSCIFMNDFAQNLTGTLDTEASWKYMFPKTSKTVHFHLIKKWKGKYIQMPVKKSENLF